MVLGPRKKEVWAWHKIPLGMRLKQSAIQELLLVMQAVAAEKLQTEYELEAMTVVEERRNNGYATWS